MNHNLDYFKTEESFKSVIEHIKSNIDTEISEASKEVASLILPILLKEINKNIFVVAPNTYEAQKLYDLLRNIEENTFFYPKDDFISTELLTESYDFKLERINTLKNIFLNKEPKIIVTNLASVLTKIIKKENYGNRIFEIKSHDLMKPKDLSDKLAYSGYDRVYTVEKQGEYALRGEILDIFPINDIKAYRANFAFDEIETIKNLNIETQRSEQEIESLVIMPKKELFFTDEETETIKFYIEDRLSQELTENTREKFEQDLQNITNVKEQSSLDKYISMFLKENYSILDYLDNKITVYYNYQDIRESEININNHIYDYLYNFKDYFQNQRFLNELRTYKQEKSIYFTTKKLFPSLDDIKVVNDDIPAYDNRLDLLKTDILSTYKESKILLYANNDNKDIIINFFNDNGISWQENGYLSPKTITISSDYIPSIYLKESMILCLNEKQIFKNIKYKKSNYKLSVETKRLKSISELKIGDYVVHYEHGIGRFEGVNTLKLKNGESDFIHLKYEGSQSIYIPVENLHLLSKYAGSEDYIPKLSNLNTKEWEKAKTSARAKAKDLAARLLGIYSTREKEQGFVYQKDDENQLEFENAFDYDLTEDQIKAINDVKADMESDRLMDRLICGDVGFGKTEVALRAAFKAVLSGKQVCYLAPTTILSRQHYYTFKARMDKFGVNVGLVNRFVSAKGIKSNLTLLKDGRLDIIIGTHRLLSRDVEFKNLGLVIIDEEQRFGVEAKEKLKEIKTNVDCLTLTATPIPRTLQMAITGLKSVSLIETAPKGRYPVQTYVLERNDFVVKDAIEREISKDGQVFYLYNRVEDMDKVFGYVHNLVPEARISMIHGKMDRDEIEDVIDNFINHESDVLISTTIIETGVDIPNANTLIIHDADRYGLSQLYQIKGRVGRSDKISYAYLMYDKNKHLTEDAEKRLKAIKDFAELGSGFKIAVRDLTTRGAGEILGREQSGFIDKVGIDLYLKMLDEEIKKETIKEVPEKKNERISISRHIDKDYISDEYALIEFHNKIANLESSKDLYSLMQEMTDRFGKVKEDLETYMWNKLFENIMNKCPFERVDISDSSVIMAIPKELSEKLDAKNIFKEAYESSPNFTFYYKVYKIFITYLIKDGKLDAYKNLSLYLEKLINLKLFDPIVD